MLYVLRSYTKKESLLKIGYANDYDDRYLQYESHNPGIEEVGKREGSLIDEAVLHLYLHFLGYGIHKDEWYKDCEEVIEIFNSSSLDIENAVWESREGIFTYYDFIKGCKKSKVYSDLYNKHKEELFVSVFTQRGIVNNFIGKDIDLKYISLNEFRELSNIIEEIRPKPVKTSGEDLLCTIVDLKTFPEQMKFIYELDEDCSELLDEVFKHLPFYYRNFYRSISPEEAKRLSYRKGVLGKRYERNIVNQDVDLESLKELVYETFNVGSKYTKSEAKSLLGNMYDLVRYSRTPKANDLEEYFEIKPCLIQNKETGKRDNGFEIIKKKE